jgi:hypothetical protein
MVDTGDCYSSAQDCAFICDLQAHTTPTFPLLATIHLDELIQDALGVLPEAGVLFDHPMLTWPAVTGVKPSARVRNEQRAWMPVAR